MNLKDLMKRSALCRAAISMTAAAAVFTGTMAVAYDKTMPTSEFIVDYTSTITVEEEEPYKIIRRANEELLRGETVVVQEGVDGLLEVDYEVRYHNGKEVRRTELEVRVVSDPIDKIVEYGTAEPENESPQGFEYQYVLECTATAYDPSPEENGGYGGMSATGVPLQKGVIAVDPSVIPLGSRVYIEAVDGSWSYGYAVAADTGGAIKGNKVDLLFMTKAECYEFGRRKCKVYVL